MKTELIIGQTPILPLKLDGFTIWGKAEFMNQISNSEAQRFMAAIEKILNFKK